MRHLIILIFVVQLFGQTFGQGRESNIAAEERLKKRTLKHAKKGQLICVDDYGNYIICTGDEFEKILGFCTNTPYITVNKAKGDNKITEHKGIASFEKGKIKIGDYLCPCKKNPGQVVRCKKKNNPYARALETPSGQGDLFMTKILGHRRKF